MLERGVDVHKRRGPLVSGGADMGGRQLLSKGCHLIFRPKEFPTQLNPTQLNSYQRVATLFFDPKNFHATSTLLTSPNKVTLESVECAAH